MAGQVAFVLAMLAVVLLARMVSDRLSVPYTIVLSPLQHELDLEERGLPG